MRNFEPVSSTRAPIHDPIFRGIDDFKPVPYCIPTGIEVNNPQNDNRPSTIDNGEMVAAKL
jgi:hypothetical protein